MKKYFVVQCYEKSKRIDGTMVWEVGEEGSRSRICLCYSKEMAERIAKTLADRIAPEPTSADAEDAARYLHLRNKAHPDSDDGIAVMRQEYSDWGKPYHAHITGSALDDLVDAARAAKERIA